MKKLILPALFVAVSGCTALDLWDAPVVQVEPRSCRVDADCTSVDFTLADSFEPGGCIEPKPFCDTGNGQCTVALTVLDSDDDGFRDIACAGVHRNLPPQQVDCIDDDATAFPNADLDRDGIIRAQCGPAGAPQDCDDSKYSVQPGASEACDGVVSDCNAPNALERIFSEDGDGDGHSIEGVTGCVDVTGPDGSLRSYPKDDCDDDNRLVFPGAVDVCDGFINDCNLGMGADPAEDADDDGFAAIGTTACVVNAAGSRPATDCDDQDEFTFPGAPEVCDRIINDCSVRTGTSIARPVEDPDADGYYAGSAPCIDPIRDIECNRSAIDRTLVACAPRREVGLAELTNPAVLTAGNLAPTLASELAVVASDGCVHLLGPAFTRQFGCDANHPPLEAVIADATGEGIADLVVVRDRDVLLGDLPRVNVYQMGGAPGYGVNDVGVYLSMAGRTAAFAHVDADAALDVVYQPTAGTLAVKPLNLPSIPTTFDAAVGTLVAIEIADVDADGLRDVVALASGTRALRYYRSLGGFTFSPVQLIATPDDIGNAQDFVVADFAGDGDGKLDFAVRGPTGVAMLAQAADGTFSASPVGVVVAGGTTTAAPYGAILASGMAAVDLDRDSRAELVYARFATDEVVYVDEIGTQLFAQHPIVTDLDGANTVSAADFDRDGDLDVVASSSQANAVSYFESTFVSNLTYTRANIDRAFNSIVQTLVGDVDEDGWPDVFAIAGGGATSKVTLWRSLSESFNSFAETELVYGTGQPSAFALGDVNGDDHLDVVVALNSSSVVNVLFGRGDGTFLPPTLVTDALSPTAMTVADENDDGIDDVFVVSSATETVAVFRGSRTGAFTRVAIDGDPSPCTQIAAGDVDVDGRVDLVAACGVGDLRYYRNLGTGFARTAMAASSPVAFARVELGDLDRDGDLDAVASPSIGTELTLVRTDAVSTFVLTQLSSGITDIGAQLAIALGDLDRDGDLEIVTGGGSPGQVRVFQALDPGRARYLGVTIAVDLEIPTSFALRDLDANGTIDIVAALRGDSDLLWWSTGGVPWWNH